MEGIFDVDSSNENLDNILSNQIYNCLSNNSIIPIGVLTHIFRLAQDGFKENLFTNFYGLIKEYKNMLEVSLQNNKNEEWTQNYVKILLQIINSYIEETNYKKRLLNELSKFNNNLNIKDLEYLGFIINYSLATIPQEYLILYLKYVIYYHRDMSTNIAKKIIIDFVYNYSKKNNTRCNVMFKNRNDICGYYREHVIFVAMDLVTDFCNYPYTESYMLFNTIFHEFEHLFQNEQLCSQIYPKYDEIIFFKDFLLSRTKANYYNGNYPYILFELYARINADKICRKFMDYLGAYYVSGEYNAKNDVIKHNSRNRVVDGKLNDIDIVFDENISKIIKYIKNSKKNFPFLNLIYDSHGKRRTSYCLFKYRNALRKALVSGDDREEIFMLVEEINTILNYQILSCENALKDSKEIMEKCNGDSEMMEYALKLKKLSSSKSNFIETISRVSNYKSCLSNGSTKKHERKLTDSTKLNL